MLFCFLIYFRKRRSEICSKDFSTIMKFLKSFLYIGFLSLCQPSVVVKCIFIFNFQEFLLDGFPSSMRRNTTLIFLKLSLYVFILHSLILMCLNNNLSWAKIQCFLALSVMHYDDLFLMFVLIYDLFLWYSADSSLSTATCAHYLWFWMKALLTNTFKLLTHP